MSAPARGAERFGGDDVGADRHDPPRDPGRRVAEPCVAAQREVAAAHVAPRGAHEHGVRAVERQRAAVLEKARAGPGRRGREPERVVERMQVAAAGIVGAGEIPLARDQVLHFIARHELQARVVVALVDPLDPRSQFIDLARLDRHVHLPGNVVAVDAVACDQVLHQVESLDRHVPQPARVLSPDERFGLLLASRDPEQRLCAAAAGGSPADARGFEYHDAVAAFGEVQGCRAARDAGADHAHVAVDVAREGRVCRSRVAGRGVIAGDVPGAHSGPRYHAHSSGVT